MAFTPVNLTFNLNDLIGTPLQNDSTKVWIESNVDGDVIIDTDGNKVRLGIAKVNIDSTGAGSFTGLVPTNAATNPTAFQYRVWVDYRLAYQQSNKSSNGRQRWNSGWFSLTATSDLADVAAESYVPPTWQSSFISSAEAIRDAAEGHADDAAASEAAAASSATAAGASRDEAETFRNQASQIALGDAEAAFDGFLGARDLPADGAELSASFVGKASAHKYISDFMGGGVSDTTALTNALAASAGKTLHLEGKTLNLEDLIEITANGVTIETEGATLNITDDGTAEGHILRVMDAEDFTWRGGTLAQEADARTGVYGLLTMVRADRYSVSDLTIIGGAGGGFMDIGSLYGAPTRVRVRDTMADGFHFTRGAKFFTPTGCYAKNTGDDMFAIVSVLADGSTTYDPCEGGHWVNCFGDGTPFGGGFAFIGALNCGATGGGAKNTTDAALKFGTDSVAGTYRAIGNKVTGMVFDTVLDPTKSVIRIGASDDTTLVNVDALNSPGVGVACLGGAVRATYLGGRVSGSADYGVYDDGSGIGGDVAANGNNFIGVDLRGNTGGAHIGSGTFTNCLS